MAKSQHNNGGIKRKRRSAMADELAWCSARRNENGKISMAAMADGDNSARRGDGVAAARGAARCACGAAPLKHHSRKRAAHCARCAPRGAAVNRRQRVFGGTRWRNAVGENNIRRDIGAVQHKRRGA